MSKYQVTVTTVSEESPKLLKALRLVANLEIKEAKNISSYLINSLPCVLVAGVDHDVAEHIVNTLREGDAIAIVEPSNISSPMLLYPPVNQRYTWHMIKGISAIGE
jgi:ribosomal protein L7/L12